MRLGSTNVGGNGERGAGDWNDDKDSESQSCACKTSISRPTEQIDNRTRKRQFSSAAVLFPHRSKVIRSIGRWCRHVSLSSRTSLPLSFIRSFVHSFVRSLARSFSH